MNIMADGTVDLNDGYKKAVMLPEYVANRFHKYVCLFVKQHRPSLASL